MAVLLWAGFASHQMHELLAMAAKLVSFAHDAQKMFMRLSVAAATVGRSAQ
jgi:hypothetical protein